LRVVHRPHPSSASRSRLDQSERQRDLAGDGICPGVVWLEGRKGTASALAATAEAAASRVSVTWPKLGRCLARARVHARSRWTTNCSPQRSRRCRTNALWPTGGRGVKPDALALHVSPLAPDSRARARGLNLLALDCEVEEMLPRHDHSIVIGRVCAVSICPGSFPLVYWQGDYHPFQRAAGRAGNSLGAPGFCETRSAW
jgi:hypothetical protein